MQEPSMRKAAARLGLISVLALVVGPALGLGCSSNQRAASTGDGSTDVGPGTWTDPSTGLLWQDPLFVERRTWDSAISACAALRLEGYDDWRLPTLDELRSLARGCPATVTGGTCPVTDQCLDSGCWREVCQGCDEMGGPSPEGCYRLFELHGDCMTSWTSGVVPNPPNQPEQVWTVGFGGCHVLPYPMSWPLNTRCVRRAY